MKLSKFTLDTVVLKFGDYGVLKNKVLHIRTEESVESNTILANPLHHLSDGSLTLARLTNEFKHWRISSTVRGNPLQGASEADAKSLGENSSTVSCLQSMFSPMLMILLASVKLLVEYRSIFFFNIKNE